MMKRSRLCTSLMAACGGVFLSAGWAQDAQQLQRVEVTGSNIKRTDTETASPVQILNRADIERTGKQSIQEVLRSITADGQGSIPSSFSNGFASGSAAISLRGLGVNSTLVLLNGRRMTTYGLADDGTRTFVDLNTIPLELVERVEVLKDGGSSVYGSDAVGGVVNIILRKNYQGATIGGTVGTSQKGDGTTTRGFGTYGFGNLDADKYNVFVSLEASRQNHIWSRDRGYIGDSDLRGKGFYDTSNGAPRLYLGVTSPGTTSPYGVTRTPDLSTGTLLGVGQRVNVLPCDAPTIRGGLGIDPSNGTGLCRYNGLSEQEVQPRIERLNLFSRGTLQIAPSLQAYLELGYFRTETKANGTLGGNNDGGVFNPADPGNLIVHNLMILPANHPDNTFGVDRTLAIAPHELGGRDQTTKNEVFRVVQAFQGSTNGFDYEVGGAYIKSRLQNTNKGYIRYGVMQDALNNGTYRITSPNITDPAVIDAISPSLRTTPESSIKLIDAKVSREVASLPGGGLGIAIGGEVRWENATNPAVPYTDTGEIVGLGYSQFRAKRRVEAIYGEVTAPVLKWLEISGGARYDHYSDFGGTTNPKIGFKLKPIDQLALRGTYAEAFRAPGPAETGGSSFGFTSVGILSQGSPDIKPETAKSYTLGIIAEPFSGTSATVDYWKIKRKNEIVQADPNAIIGDADGTGTPNSRIPGALPNTFIYYGADGTLSTVTGFYSNAARTTTDGVDVELRNRLRLGEAGNFTTSLFWTYTHKFKRTDANGNTAEYSGTHGPISLSAGAGTPKNRLRFEMTWDKGPYSVTGAVNYIGKLKLVNQKGEKATPDEDDPTVVSDSNGLFYYNNTGNLGCASFNLDGGYYYKGCKLPSFTTFDLFARWSPIKNLDVNFSVQNVLDKRPPFDPYLVNTYGINYNQTWHQSGAVGRFFTVGAKYTF